MINIIQGDAKQSLLQIPDQSISCCVTSPPYFGMRDYGVEGQIGKENLLEEYVENLVGVFREVRRTLRDDGTLWVNLGDAYATGTKAPRKAGNRGINPDTQKAQDAVPRIGNPSECKTKDLIGIPWLVAFELRADGWYLRQDIIWNKPNPMPEAVKDRCTKAHEYVFLLSKSQRYFFDKQAFKQRPTSVWTIPTKAFKGAHFATFPIDLVEPCVLAGCPPDGVVLDPFFGAGTIGVVAARNARKCIGIELNPEYVEIANKRIGI